MSSREFHVATNPLTWIIYSGYILLGLFLSFNFVVLAIITFPILIYRVLVTKLVAPCFRPEIQNAVHLNGHAFSTEFLKKYRKQSPRCTLVTVIVLEGNVDEENITRLIQNEWIEKRNGETGELMYPELKQYIEQWLGFMFWKQDKNFDLKNHLHFSHLSEKMSPSKSKQFGNELIEKLLNRPYDSNRSPWDLHFIRNYKDPEYPDTKEMTLTVFRCHHSMADGHSIFQLLLEGLCSVSMSEVALPRPPRQISEKTRLDRILDSVKFPFKLLHGVGSASSPIFSKSNPWHCPDEIKDGKQIYCRSPKIQIERIKFIKNKLGCSFTSVLISSISKAASNSFKSRGFQGSMKSFPFGIALPLPGHPKTLSNYVTGTLLELSANDTLNPVERLHLAEKSLNDAMKSYAHLLPPVLIKLVSLPFAPITRFVFKNRYVCSGLSSFPGPAESMKLGGSHRVLATHFATGALDGVGGIAFTALSYDDAIHITVTTEAAVMSKIELDELVHVIYEEINKLYEFCMLMNDEK